MINGYPKRGTNIFGFADKTEEDMSNRETGKPFTILSYGSGPGNKYGELRPDPREQKNLGTNTFVNWATVHLEGKLVDSKQLDNIQLFILSSANR